MGPTKKGRWGNRKMPSNDSESESDSASESKSEQTVEGSSESENGEHISDSEPDSEPESEQAGRDHAGEDLSEDSSDSGSESEQDCEDLGNSESPGHQEEPGRTERDNPLPESNNNSSGQRKSARQGRVKGSYREMTRLEQNVEYYNYSSDFDEDVYSHNTLGLGNLFVGRGYQTLSQWEDNNIIPMDIDRINLEMRNSGAFRKQKKGVGSSKNQKENRKKRKNQKRNNKKSVGNKEDDIVASADEVRFAAILDSAKSFEKLRNDHELYNQRRTKPYSKVLWSYHDPITEANPELITKEGCRLILRMGKDIPNFNPINPSAVIHYLDNHDCPNGLMPVLALVLMELSEYELSFQEAHKIICAFAREQKKRNQKIETFEGEGSSKEQASLAWLHLSEWSDPTNDTSKKIFEGT